MEPLKVKQVHVRGSPIGTAQIMVRFLEQRVRDAGHRVDPFLEDFPKSSGSIEILTRAPYKRLARIQLELIPNRDWLSLEWESYTVEMNAVLDDLLSELCATCHDVKIVGP